MEDDSSRKRIHVKRGRREWSELAFYDRTAMLESVIDAAILGPVQAGPAVNPKAGRDVAVQGR